MNKEKMVISAQQVLEDIRSGMDDEGFMVKYGLSFRQLQRLFRKMILGGYITPQELAQRLCVTKSQVMEAMCQVNKAISELDE
jgi:DNA-binding MarR family transcriptional regulator